MHPNDTALNEFADGSIDTLERPRIEQHLATCAACRQAVEDLRDIIRVTSELDMREPPVRAWSRLERAIKLEGFEKGAPDEEWRRPSRPAIAGPKALRHTLTWLAAAAALVLATAIGVRYVPSWQPDATPSDTR